MMIRFKNQIEYENTYFNLTDFGGGTIKQLNNYEEKERTKSRLFLDNQQVSKKPISKLTKVCINEIFAKEQHSRRCTELFEATKNYLKPITGLKSEVELADIRKFSGDITNCAKDRIFITINGKRFDDFQSLLISFFQDYSDHFQARVPYKEAIVEYFNGDLVKGKKIKYGYWCGDIQAWYYDGYSYQGKMMFSEAWGWGTYRDALGNERKGYFFKGYILKDSYGLEAYYPIFEEELLKNNLQVEPGKSQKSIGVNPEVLNYLLNPSIFKSLKSKGYFGDPASLPDLQRDKIFHDIKISIVAHREYLEMLKEGENDYNYNWRTRNNDITRFFIFQHENAMKSNILGKIKKADGEDLNSSADDKNERNHHETRLKKDKPEKPQENSRLEYKNKRLQ